MRKEENKNPTPRELARVCNWEAVKKSLRFHYGGKWNKAIEVFEIIRRTRKAKHKTEDEYLEVKCGGFLVFDEEGISERFYSIHTNKYSLSFRKWKELSNIPFDEETVRRYRPEELLAHFIYEITWHGDEKRSIKIGNVLRKCAQNLSKRSNPPHNN